MKERLTGAVILVALLVLLVPELLTGPSRSVRTAQPATTPDGAQMRSYTINLADDAARSATAPVTEAPAPETKPVDPQTSEAGAQPGGDADANAAKPADGADAGRADVDSAQAEQPGGSTPSGNRDVPPTAVRAEAPKPAAAVRADAPKATTPAAATRAEAPLSARGGADAKPTSGWAVQVGSFASRDNADRLARELKGKGFAATVSQSPKGRRLWRVRVGPEADRAAAVALGAKLHSVGQSGAVVPYP